MAGINLYDYQLDAVKRMRNGCILCGGVGSGKSRTSLAYYWSCMGGKLNTKNYVKNQRIYILSQPLAKEMTLSGRGNLLPSYSLPIQKLIYILIRL